MGLLSSIGGPNPMNDGGDKKQGKTVKQDIDLTKIINQSGGVFNYQRYTGDGSDISFKPAKVVTEYNDDGSKTEKQYDEHGKVFRETIFKDVNGDGKEDIYSTTTFLNGNSSTYIDKDGDGYYDVNVYKEYDEKGKLKKETKVDADDINTLLNPKEGEIIPPYMLEDRKIDNKYYGILVK